MNSWCTVFPQYLADLRTEHWWLMLDAGARLAQTYRALADWWRVALRSPAIAGTVRRRRQVLLDAMRFEFIAAHRDQSAAIHHSGVLLDEFGPSFLNATLAAVRLAALFPPPRVVKIRRLLDRCGMPLTECDTLRALIVPGFTWKGTWDEAAEKRYLEHAPPYVVAKQVVPTATAIAIASTTTTTTTTTATATEITVRPPSRKRQRRDNAQ